MTRYHFKVYTDDTVYPKTFDLPTCDEDIARTNLAVLVKMCREGKFSFKIVRVALYDTETQTTLETLTV